MFSNPIQPVKTNFGKDIDTQLEKYVYDRISSIQEGTRQIRETDVKEWRRLLQGKPQQEKKSFPWENASNVVIGLSGTCKDILQAAIIGSIWGILPIYVTSLVGSWDEQEQSEEQRNALEEAMVKWSSEPNELNLYPVENLWFGEGIGFGTSFVKCPYEYITETQVLSITGDGDSAQREEVDFVKRYGPSPQKLEFEDFGVEPTASSLAIADFKYHVRRLKKWELLDRAQKGFYAKDLVDKIARMPDRHGPAEVKDQALQDLGIYLQSCPVNAEWDVHECWFQYNHPNGRTYSIIYPYHFRSRTCLKSTFNFYPENDDPFRMCRLGWDDDGIYGVGFAKMLKYYQEEVSTGHNQRCDNRTLRNTPILRVSRVSKLDSNFAVYPLATLPGEKDEVELMEIGSSAAPDIDGEQLTISLAERRAGVELGIQGPGGGTTNPKKGVYSAMGTFAVMQAGNRRNNLRTTDMRYAHIDLGRLILKLYAYFGIGDKGRVFGKKEELLRQALNNVRQGRMEFPIKAASESVNKELEKQNLMLLVNVIKQHHMGVAQLLQSIGQAGQMIDDVNKKYLLDTIKAQDYLMQDLLRAFNMNDIARLLPLPEFLKGAMNAIQQGGTAGADASTSIGNNIQQVNGVSHSGQPTTASGMGKVSTIPM